MVIPLKRDRMDSHSTLPSQWFSKLYILQDPIYWVQRENRVGKQPSKSLKHPAHSTKLLTRWLAAYPSFDYGLYIYSCLMHGDWQNPFCKWHFMVKNMQHQIIWCDACLTNVKLSISGGERWRLEIWKFGLVFKCLYTYPSLFDLEIRWGILSNQTSCKILVRSVCSWLRNITNTVSHTVSGPG